MTQVFLDPGQLADAAALLRRVQSEVAELGAAIAGACCCDVPSSLSYVDSELGAVGASIDQAAGGMGAAAQDASGRADLVVADQSLAGAMTAAYGGATAITAVIGAEPVAGSPGASWLDRMDSGPPLTADRAAAPAATDWLTGMAAANVAASTDGWHFVAPATGLITAASRPSIFDTAQFNATFGGQAAFAAGESPGSSIIGHGPTLHENPDPDYTSHGVFTIDFAGQAGSV